jgi:ABC-type multidrug transport system fused ATPase/permease subunit
VRILIRCLYENRTAWRMWLVPMLLALVLVPLSLGLPLVQKHLIDDVLIARRLDLLVPTMLLFAGVWLLSAIVAGVSSPVQTRLDELVTIRLRRALFHHCEALSVPLWHREHSGRTMALFSNDAPRLAGFLGTGMVSLFSSVVTLLAGALVMLQLSWQLALIVVTVPPLFAAGASLVARPLRTASRRVQDKSAELNERLHESLGGLREIAAFGQERVQGERLALTLHELLQLRLRLAVIGAVISAGHNVFSFMVLLTMLGVGGYLVITGQTTIGTLFAMQQLFGMVYQPATALMGMTVSAQQTVASADRLYALLDLKPLVEELPGAIDPGELPGEVKFENVSFAYQADRQALNDVSFTAMPGQVIALVGPSGAGKSTLVGLIARFYDPIVGRIFVDRHNIREFPLDALRRQIGLVFQDPFLFATTIRENIAFGREGATEAEIVQAARDAHAWEFIEQLPLGLDTLVGQRATRLSEGQKQRLAIARALLRDPRILILDEPTSSLDARSEHLVQRALDNLMRGRTTFVIAHRLATIRRADRILVLDGGRIVQQGTHPELLTQPGLYQELFELQFGRRTDMSSRVDEYQLESTPDPVLA